MLSYSNTSKTQRLGILEQSLGKRTEQFIWGGIRKKSFINKYLEAFENCEQTALSFNYVDLAALVGGNPCKKRSVGAEDWSSYRAAIGSSRFCRGICDGMRVDAVTDLSADWLRKYGYGGTKTFATKKHTIEAATLLCRVHVHRLKYFLDLYKEREVDRYYAYIQEDIDNHEKSAHFEELLKPYMDRSAVVHSLRDIYKLNPKM